MKITIFGKDGCKNCERAKAVLVDADYKKHSELYDIYDMDTATDITTATDGNLPIIIIETLTGRLVLGMGKDGHLQKRCENGACRIERGIN